MKKPVIGISGSIVIDQGGMLPGYQKTYVNNDYIKSVERAGGVPMVLPILNDKDLIEVFFDKIDALIMSGGHDVNPLLYGEEPDVKLTQIFPERDEFDFELIKQAKKKGIPIMGICRGMQILNTYHGGSIYQDNSYCESSYVKHWQGHTSHLATHTAIIEKDSFFHEILGDEVLVNSFHHQSVKKVGDGLKVTARAKDGVVELIEGASEQLVVGFQWHPEMMSERNETMQSVFDNFIAEATK
jgi:putative glutamine amidotransferase